MRLILLVVCLFLVGCGDGMRFPDDLRRDAALADGGITDLMGCGADLFIGYLPGTSCVSFTGCFQSLVPPVPPPCRVIECGLPVPRVESTDIGEYCKPVGDAGICCESTTLAPTDKHPMQHCEDCGNGWACVDS